MDDPDPRQSGPDMYMLHQRCMQSRDTISQSGKIVNLSQLSLEESAVVLEDLRALLNVTERF